MSLATLAPAGTAEGELRSVSIAVAVLDCFETAGELGPTQVARRMGIAKSTASRMLSALACGGMLERAPGGRYRLSLRLFQYGQLAVDRLPLRAIARPVLVQLHAALRETVQLGLPMAGHVLYVERMNTSALDSRLSGEVLRRVPAYSSSAGRVMAAFDPHLATAMAGVDRRRHTPFTVVDDERLSAVVARARSTGWVASREEFERGFSSVAAPILLPPSPSGPRVAGAVSVVGRTAQILGPRREFLTASVCRAARRISADLRAAQEAG
jgi:IclR family KDG regulon transcriptional repressor